MKNYICETCGVQYDCSIEAPDRCMICEEERQFVSVEGQTWTTLDAMVNEGVYKNVFDIEEEGVHAISIEPSFGIGQTAYLIQDQNFCLLWDCITYIDQETLKRVEELGGIDAIALSHPHYYSTQVEWAEAFNAPIYIHEDDRKWVTRPSERIIFWSGESLQLKQGLTLHRMGGHFKGGTILEWQNGNNHKGILFTGDIIRIVADRDWVSFMYSYPNFIPLPSSTVERVADRVKDFKFTRLYDAFHRVISEEAELKVQKSAHRYIGALNGTLFDT
ncbi:MBL fold metallo-hydrolase [Cytobacillus purgationiresistens]|uniref:Glyoxylase-like metal-dependent hydrolase (Beta-lactamase superfamily II) n=1 Tax=Cytobacillus purgationiresistens TaxID=863449 RepID=A0ABU0AL16_9BACI|nr:MBL fold metallo-hydrolase [Cytobacillus purgationiresistens]MDQ0271416.1 glyoxylase-like metal-dependent hydrolase (beta-lactamase superfamily II) [Cytobacillus purgationiresistens]